MKKDHIRKIRRMTKRVIPLLLAVAMLTTNISVAAEMETVHPTENISVAMDETASVVEDMLDSGNTDGISEETTAVEQYDEVTETGETYEESLEEAGDAAESEPVSEADDASVSAQSEPESEASEQSDMQGDLINVEDESSEAIENVEDISLPNLDEGANYTDDEESAAAIAESIDGDLDTNAIEVEQGTEEGVIEESEEDSSFGENGSEDAVEAVADQLANDLQATERYTVKLNANGGIFPEDESTISRISVENVYSLEDIDLPTPEKEKAVFTGWFMDADCEEAADMTAVRAESVSLYAGWEEHVLVTFITAKGTLHDSETGQESETIQKEYVKGSRLAESSYPYLVGDFWDYGWFIDDNYSHSYDTWAELAEDITLYKRAVSYYTVTFHANGGYFQQGSEQVDTIENNYQESESLRARWITIPQNNSAAFSGWYKDEACTELVDLNAPLTEGVELYAGWTDDYVTVTFKTSRGVFWDDDLEGEYEEVVKKVKRGVAFSDINKPRIRWSEEYGYIDINGWYKDEALIEELAYDEAIVADIDIWAKSARRSTITFNANGGKFLQNGEESEIYETTCYGWLSISDLYFHVPVKDGSAFDTWYYDAECTKPADLASHPDDDIVLYAGYTDDVINVTFVLQGGVLHDDSTGEEAETITKIYKRGITFDAVEKPAVVGDYSVCGWCKDNYFHQYINWDDALDADITIFIEAYAYYYVTYHGNGGHFFDNQEDYTTTVQENQSFISVAPGVSSEAGALEGWYYDQTCSKPVSESDMPNQDTELWAGWVSDYVTVTFTTAEGELYDPVTGITASTIERKYVKGDKISYSNLPCIVGNYWEQGWYSDEALQRYYDLNTVLTNSITIYLRTEAYIYVSFDANGGYFSDGNVIESNACSKDQLFRYLGHSNPIKEDAVFDQWFLDKDCTSPIPDDYKLTEDITVYAGWTTDYVTVTYKCDYGLLNDYNLGVEGTEIKVLYKTGSRLNSQNMPSWYAQGAPYVFDRWILGNGQYTTLDTSMVLNEDITVYAVLSRTYEITLDANGGVFSNWEGQSSSYSYSIKTGDQIIPGIVPYRSGYGFERWYYDADCTDPLVIGSPISKDIRLYASWSSNTVNVIFDPLGAGIADNELDIKGEGIRITKQIKKGEPLSIMRTPYPLDDGNYFTWYRDKECTVPFNIEESINEDITLYGLSEWGEGEIWYWFRGVRPVNLILDVNETIDCALEMDQHEGYTIDKTEWE